MRHGSAKPMSLWVLVPCYNEEEGVGKVVERVPIEALLHNGYKTTVLVIDNNSTDKTAQVARAAGAKVLTETKKGKGNAMRAGFAAVPKDADFVVMLDGDDTYDASEIVRMIEPLHSDFCDVVIGSRLGGKMEEGAMRFMNRAGNWFFTHLVRIYYRVNVTDVLTGYFAWKRECVDQLLPHLVSEGFAIEMEMITKMAKLGQQIYSVPISYNPRSGQTNLRPFADGRRILKAYIASLRWQPSHSAHNFELES